MSNGLNSSNDQFVSEHYKELSNRFTSQGDRLWKRFHFFLTVDVALASAFIARSSIAPSSNLESIGPSLGVALSMLWFIIGAQDLWFYDNARKKLHAFKSKEIIPQMPNWQMTDEEYRLPIWELKHPLRFVIPKIGVTTFASAIPLLCIIVWICV